MCSMSVLCPLCAESSFASIDALRISLIRAANGPLPCPICHELLLGLDKLTIHLFSHTNILAASKAEVKSATFRNGMEEPEKSLRGLVNDSDEMRAILAPCTDISSNTQHNSGITDASCSTDLLSCDVCEFNFRNRELLELHFRLVHQNDTATASADVEQQPQCCASSSPNEVHDLRCHLCSKTFKMKGSLRVHLRVVHLIGMPADSNASKPSICDRIRSQKSDMTATTVKTNPTTIVTNTSTATLQVDATHSTPHLMTVDGDKKPAQAILASQGNRVCNELNLKTSNGNKRLGGNSSLVPTTTTNNNNNNAIEESLKSSDLERDNALKIGNENAKIWDCDVCSKSFTTKYFLKKHKRLHTGEMPYTCAICARTFTFQQSYHKHLLYHSDDKPHVCATCGRAFKELSTLHNHERIHSGEKPFKCEVCGKSFRQRVSFLVHTRIHTGVMPYKCDICQKSFRYKVSQRTHKCNLPAKATEAGAFNSSSTSDDYIAQISENFIKAFLESTTAAAVTPVDESLNSSNSLEIAIINTNTVDNLINQPNTDTKNSTIDEAMLSKTIDDIVVESCNRMGIYSIDPILQASSSPIINEMCGNSIRVVERTNSPSLKFQNMRLYSPEMGRQQINNAIDSLGDDFPQFFVDHENAI